MVKVISIKRCIALAGIVLYVGLNACRTCNCPAYSEEKPPPDPPMGESPYQAPLMGESYNAIAESGIESLMPD
jgi:hypothetical protein